MFNNQLTTFSSLIKNENLQNYAGDAFLNLIKAVAFSDFGAGVKTIDDVRKLLFHIPTLLFWDKMKRYLYGTFRNYEDQIKFAAKFNRDNLQYEKFVKRQIHLINELDDDEKIDYFAQLTRAFLMTELEESLFFKLVKYLNICTPYELAFLRSVSIGYSTENNAVISSLYQYGLFVQETTDSGDIKYILSDFAKALKQNCLNFNDGINGKTRLVSYDQISPLSIVEPLTVRTFDEFTNNTDFILNSGSSTEVL